ncbi:hypothetical protein Asi03nite_29560 [Actinoplanes siamensis]|uniref:Uncharacterized protein n=1 Tax=Actinoplanes siamensis TaxID=1223317 RepID=A0A919N6S6_9ACTN|nr:hypothetical protein Asi03nite_29560 [Actinoplanes siamensis]
MPALVLSSGLAGCAGQGAAGTTGATPRTGSPAPAAVLPLDFSRTGGFAGFDDHLHIEPDGTATVTHRGVTGRPLALDADRIAALRQVLAEPGLARATTPAATTAICADGFRYALSTPSWTLTSDDCSGARPQLDRVLELLVPLVRSDPASPA